MKAWRLGLGRRRRGTSHRPGRFHRMLSNRILWPSMIGIALAVGIGVQMGESAVSAIDPIHFRGAAARPQGIDPNVAPPAQSAYAQAYGWDQGNAARVTDSGFQDFSYIPQPVSVQRVAEPVWHEESGPLSLTPWPPGQVSSHPEVERYIDYPIEEKPVAQRPAPQEPEEAVEPEEPEQPDASALSTSGK
jgi:hypothetical protein